MSLPQLIASGLLGLAFLFGQGAQANSDKDDGPYIRYLPKSIEARWLCDDKVVREVIPATTWPVRVAPRCGYPREILVRKPAPVETATRVEGAKRLVALSDVHGQYDLMLQLLRANGVIDDASDWAYGTGTLVMPGDVFDRGPRHTEVLWHLYALEQQAREAGGALLFLLGNHETMVLGNDQRYLHGKYAHVAKRLGTPYPNLFAPGTALGDWLRAKRTVLQVDDWLFLHGGLSPQFLALGLDLAEVNQRMRESLSLDKNQRRANPRYAALYDPPTSPVWYRGYFEDATLTNDHLDALLHRLGVSAVIVGHTTQDSVQAWHGGRVIVVDAAMKEGSYGELLFREDGKVSRGTLAGERLGVVVRE